MEQSQLSLNFFVLMGLELEMKMMKVDYLLVPMQCFLFVLIVMVKTF